MTILNKFSMLTAAIALGTAVPAYAQIEWRGGSLSNVDWSVGSNWKGGAAPGAGNTALFKNSDVVTFTQNLPTSLGTIQLNDSSQVTMTPGSAVSLTVGTITLNSTSQLTINSNYSVTANTDLVSASGATMAANGTFVFSGTGAGHVLNGTTTFAGPTTFSGDLVINPASCTVSAAMSVTGTLTSGSMANSSTITVGSGGTIDLSGTLSGAGTIAINSGGAMTVTTALSSNNTINVAFGATSANSAAFTNTGTVNDYGTWTSTAVVNTSGPITIGNGTNAALMDNINVNVICSSNPTISVAAGAAMKFRDGTVGLHCAAAQTASLLLANTAEFKAVHGAIDIASAVTITDNAGAVYRVNKGASSASLQFNTTYATGVNPLAGDFRLDDTGSTFVFANSVDTGGSFYSPYSPNACSGKSGAGSFSWATSGGVPAGNCP